MATDNRHPETVLMVMALATALGLALLFQPDPAPVRVSNQPAPAAWERRAWENSKCDRCGKAITSNPEDGLYIIGGQGYWVHKRCARALAKVAGR